LSSDKNGVPVRTKASCIYSRWLLARAERNKDFVGKVADARSIFPGILCELGGPRSGFWPKTSIPLSSKRYGSIIPLSFKLSKWFFRPVLPALSYTSADASLQGK